MKFYEFVPYITILMTLSAKFSRSHFVILKKNVTVEMLVRPELMLNG